MSGTTSGLGSRVDQLHRVKTLLSEARDGRQLSEDRCQVLETRLSVSQNVADELKQQLSLAGEKTSALEERLLDINAQREVLNQATSTERLLLDEERRQKEASMSACLSMEGQITCMEDRIAELMGKVTDAREDRAVAVSMCESAQVEP